jgi:class 3 adenylate cyclase
MNFRPGPTACWTTTWQTRSWTSCAGNTRSRTARARDGVVHGHCQFDRIAQRSGVARWRQALDAHDHVVEGLLTKYGGRRAKHTGDGVFALFDGPTKAARCGLELIPTLATVGIRIRAGIHVGECEKRGDEWSGMAVHIGARIGAMAGADEVLTSRTVRDLSAGSGLRFESLGPRRLKGLPEEVDVYRVTTPTSGLTP